MSVPSDREEEFADLRDDPMDPIGQLLTTESDSDKTNYPVFCQKDHPVKYPVAIAM